MSSPGSPPANMGSTKTAADRRPSQGVAFAGLMNQKRNSTDAAAAARRASFHDAKPQVGVFGQMWNNFIHGSSPAK